MPKLLSPTFTNERVQAKPNVNTPLLLIYKAIWSHTIHSYKELKSSMMEGFSKHNNLLIPLFLILIALLPLSLTSDTSVDQGQRNNTGVVSGDGGGGGYSWGWGGGGGGGGGSGGGGRGSGWGYGWGGGGGGAGWWKWGCGRRRRPSGGGGDKGVYRVGEYGECMGEGRCKGMRLDCPLHCRGPCFYDCLNMCKPHCLIRRHPRPT